MRENLAISESASRENIPEEAIREELSRVLESAMFIQSDRLSRLLRFTVEATLAGDAGKLREYLIGTEVYDRKPPSADSIDINANGLQTESGRFETESDTQTHFIVSGKITSTPRIRDLVVKVHGTRW